MRTVLRFQGAAGIKFIIDKAAQGNEQAIRDLDTIEMPENLIMWDAFNKLSRTRALPNPITMLEIKNYCDLIGMDRISQRLRLMSAVDAMDSVYREWKAKHG